MAGTGRARSNRVTIFWIEVIYLLVLGILAWAYFTPGAPDWLRAPAAFGVMPTGVFWFGALGGVLISLAGVHEHRDHWDESFWTWHVIRPLVGAAVGTVAVLILMSGILAIGGDPTPSDAAGTPAASAEAKNLFYFLVAFIVGYREFNFRELIKRISDVVFTSKEEQPASTTTSTTTTTTSLAISGITPAEGSSAGGTAVQIAGSGLRAASAVKFGSNEATIESVADAQLDVTTPAGEAGTVTVTVVTPNGSVDGGSFTYT